VNDLLKFVDRNVKPGNRAQLHSVLCLEKAVAPHLWLEQHPDDLDQNSIHHHNLGQHCLSTALQPNGLIMITTTVKIVPTSLFLPSKQA